MVEQGSLPDSASKLDRGLLSSIEMYLRWHSVEGHTADTIESYRKRLKAFAAFLTSRDRPTDLAQLVPLDILAYLEHLKASGCAPETVRSRFKSVRAFLSWAEQWEIVDKNVAEKLRPPKVPKVSKPFVTDEIFQKLLALCPVSTFLGARRATTYWVLRTSGVRLRELWGLKLDDLNWRGGWMRVMGKGQKERKVPFHDQAQLVCQRYLKHRTDDWPELWVTEERRPMSYRAISTDLVRLMERAGVKYKDRAHAFRRTVAADSQRAKIPRQHALAIMGWTTTAMLDRYTSWMEQESEEALEAFRGLRP